VVEFGPGHYLYTDNSRNKGTGAAFSCRPTEIAQLRKCGLGI
jgi:hypothetical protein